MPAMPVPLRQVRLDGRAARRSRRRASAEREPIAVIPPYVGGGPIGTAAARPGRGMPAGTVLEPRRPACDHGTWRWMMGKWRGQLWAAGVATVALCLTGSDATADVICKKKSGVVVVHTGSACKPKE